MADVLAKPVSDRELVPMGVFANNQYKPSVHYEELEQTGDGPPASGSGDEDPTTEPYPQTD